MSAVLAVLCLGMVARAADDAKADAKPEAKRASSLGSGWFSLGTTFVWTEGDDQRFSKDQQVDDHFFYGLRGMEWQVKAGGWLASLKGRALRPDDYGVDVKFSKKNVGWLRAYYDQFPSYFDSGRHHYAFAPYVYHLNKDLTIRRRTMGVDVAWAPRGGPELILRLNRWERTGSASTSWGSRVSGPSDVYLYPQFTTVDQERNRISLEVHKELGRFDFESGVKFQDFRGRNDVSHYRFAADGTVDQLRKARYSPDFTEVNPYFRFTGDVIENVLRWEVLGQYSYTRTGSIFDEDAFDSDGNPTSASRAHNYLNNRHKGSLNMALVNTRLVYTPNKVTTFFGGVGLKYEHSDHWSVENEDDDFDGIADETTYFDTGENRRVWMGNLGVQVRPLRWLTAKAEAKIEHSDVVRDWREAGVWRYRNHGYIDRINYGLSLTARPVREWKFIARWRQTKLIANWHEAIDAWDGRDDRDHYYPGIIGDTRRRFNEWAAVAQYMPCPYLVLRYKWAFRTTDYVVKKEPDSETANWYSMMNCISASVSPIDKLTLL